MTKNLSISIEADKFMSFDLDIDNVERQLLKRLRDTNEEMAHRAVEILTTYPPEVPGNFPPAPYWQRGTGMINSFGETIQPSKQYGQSKDRWNYETYFTRSEIVTKASTNIPYAPYVGNVDLQAWFHEEAGWMTDDETVKFIEPEAQDAFSEAIGMALIDLFQNT